VQAVDQECVIHAWASDEKGLPREFPRFHTASRQATTYINCLCSMHANL
jgi:hypothetical protein